MKNKKSKIIAFVLVFALLFATVIVTSVANAKTTDIQITADKATLSSGDTATISVKVTTNYPVATMSIPVFYDKALVTVSDCVATLSNYSVENIATNATSVDSDKIYANTGISSNDYGFVLVNYIGGAGENVPETLDGVVLTFKITAKTGVSGTATVICVDESAKTDSNVAGMLYFGAVPTGKTIDAIPDNVKNINVDNANISVAINSASAGLQGVGTGVVDNENKYIYGVPANTPEDELNEFFTIANGSFEMVANSSGYTNGTGAKVNVKNSSGTVIDTYTLVVFGDVDGNATVNATDITSITLYTQNSGALTEIAEFAANVNGDSATNATDITNLTLYTQNAGTLPVNPYA